MEAKSPTLVSLKCFYGEKILRIAVDGSSTTYAQLVDSLRKTFGLATQQEVEVFYEDEESDRIKITSDLEWCEALGFARNANVVLRLYIQSKYERSFVRVCS
jgi:hypothetical protein